MGMLRDVQQAFRTLGRARGFTLAAVITLGLGMGANTIVYAMVDALLLRPLPFGDRSDRLVTLHSTHPSRAQDWDNSLVSYADLIDVKDQARTLEPVEGALLRNLSMSSSGDTERVRGASVTPGLFGMLNVAPHKGRPFTDADGTAPGFESVVIISYSLWQRLYGADPSLVGRGVLVNGRQLTVVGIMPPQFGFPENQEVWLPLRYSPGTDRGARSVIAFAVLQKGVALEQARGELRGIAARLAAEYPATNREWSLHVIPMRDLFVQTATRRAVTALLGGVAFVLLVACANVASLLIARGIGRQRELAMRAALGAGRGRLVRLLLVESVVLSLAGGLVGLLIATWGMAAFLAVNPEPPPYWLHLGMDGRIVAYSFALAVLAGLGCGLLPALKVTRLDTAVGALQGDRSAGSTRAQRKFQGALVVGQVGVSFALLVGAMLLTRSAIQLQTADVGFDARPLLSLRLYLAGDAYDDPVARARAVERVAAGIGALPGVSAAGATGAIPADDGGRTIEVLPAGMDAEAESMGAQLVPVNAGLFAALGIAPVQGRAFTATEVADPQSASVIVSQRLARRLWPDRDAIGRPLQLAGVDGPTTLRVVGVVPDLVYEELGEETSQSQLVAYVPHARTGWRTMAFLVRTPTDPASIVPAVRGAVRAVDPAFAMFDVMTMERRRVFTQWGERFVGRTFAAFAVAALLLACVGAYGLTAYAAAQRRREIGLRMAIGATSRDVVRMLLVRGLGLAVAGLAVGLPLAFVTARAVEGMLFRVDPWAPGVWLLAPLALLVPVLLANLLPARRASRDDPAIALRHE